MVILVSSAIVLNISYLLLLKSALIQRGSLQRGKELRVLISEQKNPTELAPKCIEPDIRKIKETLWSLFLSDQSLLFKRQVSLSLGPRSSLSFGNFLLLRNS